MFSAGTEWFKLFRVHKLVPVVLRISWASAHASQRCLPFYGLHQNRTTKPFILPAGRASFPGLPFNKSNRSLVKCALAGGPSSPNFFTSQFRRYLHCFYAESALPCCGCLNDLEGLIKMNTWLIIKLWQYIKPVYSALCEKSRILIVINV